jgi:hypothetical protein
LKLALLAVAFAVGLASAGAAIRRLVAIAIATLEVARSQLEFNSKSLDVSLNQLEFSRNR